MSNPVAKPQLPKVTILNTAATLNSIVDNSLEITYYWGEGSGRKQLSGQEVLKLCPEVTKIVDVVEIRDLATPQYTTQGYLEIARLIDEIDNAVVVIRGTNDLPEFAFFLDLVLDKPYPTVVVGAMRPSSALSSDGPYNAVQACSLAGSPAAEGRGVMIVANDRISSGFYTSKVSANRVDTFKSFEQGQLGIFNNYHPHFFYEPARPTHRPYFDINTFKGIQSLPKVGLIWCHVDMPYETLEQVANSGVEGLVIAGWAAAALTHNEWETDLIPKLTAKGMPIVRTSISPDLHIAPKASLSTQIAAGDLGPNKSKLVLQLALATYGPDIDKIRQSFGTDYTLPLCP